jgi:cob(I)alamin adenosyltransferase
MKIYTKTGDKGETGLYGGSRISKASARVESYGNIDELNANIGVAKSHIEDVSIINQLKKIQFDLFTVGSEASTPIDKLFLANGKARLPLVISDKEIEELETWMDEMEEKVEPLQYFILPGGGKAATFLHVENGLQTCRTQFGFSQSIRRSTSGINQISESFVRLPFVLARYVSKLHNEPEEYWNPNDRS